MNLVDQINLLKNQIQDIIDLKKNNKDLDKTKLDNDKKAKMSELKKLTDQLKENHRKERLEKQRQFELRSASRAVDSLEFGAAKKKNNLNAIETAKKSKQLREEAKEKYLSYLEKEQKYLEKDPKELPSYLFLHNNVIKEYGLCPFLKIEENQTTSDVYTLRSEWLTSQSDAGKVYFDILDDIIHKKQMLSFETSKDTTNNKILNFIKENLNESDYNLFLQSDLFIKEFSETTIKTKRLKERFRQVIHNLSVLYAENSFEIHRYLSIKYNIQIDVNLIQATKKVSQTEHFQTIVLCDIFNELLSDFENITVSIETKQKYITNSLKNLKLQLYNFLTSEPTSTSPATTTSTPQQIGKYFKRWITLTKDEQLERFESFCHFYITKLNLNNKEALISKLYELLKESFLTKRMVYRDYVWNTTKGMIENIKILHYNKETGEFTLKYTKKDKTTLKKSSTKSVLTGERVEKLINEELLHFIVKSEMKSDTKSKSDTQTDTQNDTQTENKNAFVERMKTKLKIKKMSNNDKNILYTKYDEMLAILLQNDHVSQNAQLTK